jgi:hypothetical protein
MPNFFEASNRIKELMQDGPISKLDYSFEKPDFSNFLPAYEAMIDSGNLFKYEDYDYLHNDRVVNNLQQCKNLYTPIEDAFGVSGYHFARRERIQTGQNLNFTVYNKVAGWFPEIKEAVPSLVDVCDNFIDKFGVDVWKILVFKVDRDLAWHMDVDGFYGFRLFAGGTDWKLKFREVKPECKVMLRDMTWMGKWNEVNDSVPTTCLPDDMYFTQADTGQAFLIDSMNYVHYFENKEPHYGILVKGVV